MSLFIRPDSDIQFQLIARIIWQCRVKGFATIAIANMVTVQAFFLTVIIDDFTAGLIAGCMTGPVLLFRSNVPAN